MEQIKSHILKLSDPEKSELFKWFISQMLDYPIEWGQLAEVTKRVQEWDEGKITPLSHEQFWSEVDQHLLSLKGSLLYMSPDFDEPLDDFKDYM